MNKYYSEKINAKQELLEKKKKDKTERRFLRHKKHVDQYKHWED